MNNMNSASESMFARVISKPTTQKPMGIRNTKLMRIHVKLSTVINYSGD